MDRVPRAPAVVHPFARAFLERLQDRPEAAAFVLGGYFALQHYLEYRQTADVDAWWRGAPERAALDAAREEFAKTAAAFGYGVRERTWGETTSLDALDTDRRTVFSFQVASRSVELAAPIPSPWGGLLIETLDDNLGAKMNALVARGAPRDFVDIKAAVDGQLTTIDRLWALWRAKNPGLADADARLAVRHRLASLIARTPLDALPAERRDDAAALRAWFRDVFTEESPS
jgi:hypothetical protein